MKARGKREARRPWLAATKSRGALKVRNMIAIISLFQSFTIITLFTWGDALRACPWLSYFVPSALRNTLAVELKDANIP